MKNKQIMDEQYHHYQVRKILRWIVLVLLFFVILLSVFALFQWISFWIPLVLFLVASLLMRYRERIPLTMDSKKKKD